MRKTAGGGEGASAAEFSLFFVGINKVLYQLGGDADIVGHRLDLVGGEPRRGRYLGFLKGGDILIAVKTACKADHLGIREAYLIGSDPYSDIAVLKIPCTDLTPADFGDSDTLTAGEPAIAIGNPGGIQLQGTVTAGIISATNREITIDSNTMELIQTDASINPGNSGGPLLNRYGQVIGVTSAKISASGYEGIGFAIPINTVKPIVEELVSDGYVSGRPLVGVSVRTISQLAATFYGLPRGLMVDAISSDSGAAKAGLQAGDIITHLCGSPVRSVSDACTIRNQYKAGDTVTLTYYRNGAVHDIEFVLDEQQDQTGYDF